MYQHSCDVTEKPNRTDICHKLNFVIFPVFEVYLLINSKANLPTTMSRVTLMRHSCWTTLNICIIFEFILMSFVATQCSLFSKYLLYPMILHSGLVFYTIIDIFSSQNKPAKKIIKYKDRSLSTFSLTICNNASFK